MKEQEKIIMYDSLEAAEIMTLTGWVSKGDKRYWHKDEHMARYCGCTHVKCDCGNVMTKGWTKCESCRHKSTVERYNKMPFREYNGEPVVDWDGDTYFFSEEDIIDYLEDNELESIDLLFCEENHWRRVDEDYWGDEMPEDSDVDLPKEMQEALDKLNAIIEKLPAQSYSPGKIRTEYRIKKSIEDVANLLL